MTGLAPAGVVTALAGALVLVLVPVWAAVRFVDRRAARRFPDIDVDPYVAIDRATSDRDAEVWTQAAAALLAAGLITVDDEGFIAVTARGADPRYGPEHPVEAALLDWVRGTAPPVALSQVSSEAWQRRDAYVAAAQQRLPRWARRKADLSGWAVVPIVVALAVYFAAGMTCFGPARPGSVREFLEMAAPRFGVWLIILVPPGLLGAIGWPTRRDLFAEYCRGLPPHPAWSGLGYAERRRLRTSRFYRSPADLEADARQAREGYWETGMDTF